MAQTLCDIDAVARYATAVEYSIGIRHSADRDEIVQEALCAWMSAVRDGADYCDASRQARLAISRAKRPIMQRLGRPDESDILLSAIVKQSDKQISEILSDSEQKYIIGLWMETRLADNHVRAAKRREIKQLAQQLVADREDSYKA